jgi:hypothetical protein
MKRIDIKKVMDRITGVKKSRKKYSCICDINKGGISTSGFCHKHHTDWL